MGGRDDIRRKVWALARDQHGVVARRQMLWCGLTPRQIEGLVARSEAIRLHEGVYLIGPMVSFAAAPMAAVLACGPDAWLSHRSAAGKFGLVRELAGAPFDVTITGPHRGHHRGVRLHRVKSLAAQDRDVHDGVPITSPERTLIDLAASCGRFELEATVAEAFALGLTDRERMLAALPRARGRRGVARVRAVLDAPRAPARTRSAPERRLLRLIREAGIPEPETNVRLGHWEVDFVWREQMLIVEVDAYSTHSSPWAFERDRRKTAELEDLGHAVQRVTAARIGAAPAAVIARIRRALLPE
jgi:very-short-patch-repair endonuclease